MTSAGFLETILSLAIQVSILVGVAGVLSVTDKSFSREDRLWSFCHILILLQFVVAFSLPHPRLFSTGLTHAPQYVSFFDQIVSGLGLLFLIVWFSGSLISLFGLVVSAIRTIRILKQASPSGVELMGEQLSERVGGKKVKLLSSQAVQTPFCWQIHEPVIVMPQGAFALSNQELKMIIWHEVEHLQAGHPLQLFLQRLVEALFWFHPLIWWSSRQAIRSREFYCDSRVIHSREDVLVYLKSLLHLVEKQNTDQRTLTAGFAYQNSSSLIQQRIRHLTTIQQLNRVQRQRFFWSGAVILLSALFCFIVWIPVDVSASDRSFWSPWPHWSTNILQSVGIVARDYEIDGHRLRPHEHP